jgi:hypothetical protein
MYKRGRFVRAGTLIISVLGLSSMSAVEATQVSITPRWAVYFDNLTSLDSGIDANEFAVEEELAPINDLLDVLLGPAANLAITDTASAMASEQAQYSLYGGTIGVSLPGTEDTDILLTALAGTANVDVDLLLRSIVELNLPGGRVQDVWTSTQHQNTRLKRLDLEATLHHSLNETFSILAGVRYERVAVTYSGTQQSANSRNVENLILAVVGLPISLDLASLSGTLNGNVDFPFYSFRVGASAHGNFGDRHELFVNCLLHVTYADKVKANTRFVPSDSTFAPIEAVYEIDSHTNIGPDISVGYMYRLSDRAGLDIRYRAAAHYPVGSSYLEDDPRVNHGLSIGVTAWFGD